MHTVFTYFITLIVIMISVPITLYFKSELERMFREEKGVVVFHLCNVIIILMSAFAAYAVTTTYIIGKEFKWISQIAILTFIILPIYLFGYVAFEKYKSMNRKYFVDAENGKVLVINEKYLKKK